MTDLLCITCGYQLTGLKPDGPCPECGTPIEKSLGGERLAAAEPAWLRKLARGQTLLSFGVNLSLVCLLLMVIVPLGMGFLSLVGGSPILMLLTFVMLALVLAMLAGQLMATIGAFMVTVREARLSLTEPLLSARSLTRWGMLAVLVSFVAAEAAELLLPIELAPLAAFVFIVLIFGSLTVTLTALLRHLSRLAERVPEHDLRASSLKLAKTLQWLLPLTVLVISAPAAIRAMAGADSRAAQVGTASASCMGMMLGLVLLVMLLRLSKLMTAYRRVFAGCLTSVPANPLAPH